MRVLASAREEMLVSVVSHRLRDESWLVPAEDKTYFELGVAGRKPPVPVCIEPFTPPFVYGLSAPFPP
jgi:hypothetical protein